MTTLFSSILCRSMSLLAGSIVMSSTVMMAHAGNMYVYKDSNGEVLLTNVTPSDNFKGYNKKVKVTYYPDSKKTAKLTGASKYKGYSKPSRHANRDIYDMYIRASATRHGVDPALIKAMMHTESAFNPRARSSAGAQGLMQLMPATAKRFNVKNPWVPAQNIEGAAKYIAWLTKRFKGKIEYVVAGYNAGEGNVDKYGGIPPFKETQGYVKKVLGRYNTLYKHDTGLGRLSTANAQIVLESPVRKASFNAGDSKYAQSAFDALR